MLKLLLILVPTVILFGCRTSVPGVAGFASVTDRVTHSTERPTYEDPFGQVQAQSQRPQQMVEPVGMLEQPPTRAPQSPIQQATFTAPPESNPPAEMMAPEELNPFAELPATQQKPVEKPQAPAAPESTDTSWYSEHEEGATAVRDLSQALPAGDDSPGWKRSRKALSAN